MIAIDRSKNDPFYRYKMPEASIVHEPSKTVILNLEQIAKSLSRSPQHILKFLSMNFGCTCVQSPKYALNGSFELKKIQAGIYDFIDIFVLCNECGNPETYFVYEDVLKRGCSSCGASFVQKSHKLNNQIMKDRVGKEDRRYEESNRCSMEGLLREEADNAQRIYEVFKQEEMKLEDVFREYVRVKDIKKLGRVLKEYEAGKVLECIESMVEQHKKESKMEDFIHAVEDVGFTRSEVVEYAEKPRVGKKRLPLIKKLFDAIAEENE